MSHPDDSTSEFVTAYINDLLAKQVTTTPAEASHVPVEDLQARRVANEEFREEMKSRFERLRHSAVNPKKRRVRLRQRFFGSHFVLGLLLVTGVGLPVAHSAMGGPGNAPLLWQNVSQGVFRCSRVAFDGMEDAAVYVSRRICDWRR